MNSKKNNYCDVNISGHTVRIWCVPALRLKAALDITPLASTLPTIVLE